MKRTLFIAASLLLLVVSTPKANAQWSTGLDIYSSYIWRGAKFGSGPAFQPAVDFTTGGLTIGAWGSVSAGMYESPEMDLYAGYSFDFGLSINLTDYYFDEGDWTEYSMYHYLEPSVGFETGGFSAMAAFMFLPETETTDFGEEMDTYIQAGYSFENFDITLGAGDGQYTDDGDFNICNITIGTSKEVAVTESFALPVSGSVTLNPSTGGFFIAVGISL